MKTTEIKALADALRANIAKVVVGKEDVVDKVLAALLAGGHVLLEDVPGTGKTLLSRALAASMDGRFSRIQFTPDLLPADVTGMAVFSPKSENFTFKPGPIFANIVLADEINRATPRAQSAMLECMEEKQVSSDGTTYPLPAPFFGSSCRKARRRACGRWQMPNRSRRRRRRCAASASRRNCSIISARCAKRLVRWTMRCSAQVPALRWR